MSTQHEGMFADGLRAYVRAVASALRVEPEAAWCEVAECPTGYVAVRERAVDYPDRDVMLWWDATTGWVVALEPKPGEQPVVLALVGDDVVPEPATVARAVGSALRDERGTSTSRRAGIVEPGYVRAKILAYALPVVTEQTVKIPRPA